MLPAAFSLATFERSLAGCAGAGDWERRELPPVKRGKMSVLSEPACEVLIRKIESTTPLTPEQVDAIRALPLDPRRVDSDQDIVREGDKPAHCAIILSGWAYRYKILSSGKRQIVSFHLPGDMPDLQSLHIPVSDHNIAALPQAVVAFVPHAEFRALLSRAHGLTDVFWRDTLIDSAIYREWVANVGQRPAPERIAHIFCEILTRLESLGLIDGGKNDRTFDWPITQQLLGEASGLSSVHVNRTLQALRAERMITTGRGTITVLDWPRLQDAAGFDSNYLSLVPSKIR
jgi:CRP-like cAMP-binding protein